MNIVWAGWYKEGSSDKLWGILEEGNALYNFWCRRGAMMQFKRTDSMKYWHKEDKGYKSITEDKLKEIYPTFFEEAEQKLVFDVMAGKVR